MVPQSSFSAVVTMLMIPAAVSRLGLETQRSAAMKQVLMDNTRMVRNVSARICYVPLVCATIYLQRATQDVGERTTKIVSGEKTKIQYDNTTVGRPNFKTKRLLQVGTSLWRPPRSVETEERHRSPKTASHGRTRDPKIEFKSVVPVQVHHRSISVCSVVGVNGTIDELQPSSKNTMEDFQKNIFHSVSDMFPSTLLPLHALPMPCLLMRVDTCCF